MEQELQRVKRILNSMIFRLERRARHEFKDDEEKMKEEFGNIAFSLCCSGVQPDDLSDVSEEFKEIFQQKWKSFHPREVI